MSHIFNRKKVISPQPMFFGEKLNVVRYDQQVHPIFEDLIEKQLSFFWRPEEINCSTDIMSFNSLNEHQRFVFLQNLKYQITLDSIQGRSPVTAFLPFASTDELELWLVAWTFYEGIHSRSYTHIVRSLIPNDMQDEIYDHILDNKVLMKSIDSITHYYDNLVYYLPTVGQNNLCNDINRKRKEACYLCLHAVNALESIRFTTTFAISFAFARNNLLTGCNKIIQLIARDEALHHTSTTTMINLIQEGKDHDPEMLDIAQTKEIQDQVRFIFKTVSDQEKAWLYHIMQGNRYLFNLDVKDHLAKFVDYRMTQAMRKIKLTVMNPVDQNPIPWYDNFIALRELQVAPQESEITSYLTGHIDTDVSLDRLSDIKLK